MTINSKMANDPANQSKEVRTTDKTEYKLAMRSISSLPDGGLDKAKLNSEHLATGFPPPKIPVFKASGGYPKNFPIDPGANGGNWQTFDRGAEPHPKYPHGHVPYPPAGTQIEWLSPEDPNYPADDSSELGSAIHHPTPRREATILGGNYAIDPATLTMLPKTKERLLQQIEEALSFGDDQVFYPVGGKNLPRSPTGSNENRSRNRGTHQQGKHHSQLMETSTPGRAAYSQTPTPVASTNNREPRIWSTPTMMSPDSASPSTQLHNRTLLDSLPRPFVLGQDSQREVPDVRPATIQSKTYPLVKRITTGSTLKPESPAFTFAEPYTSSPDSTSSSKAKGDRIRFGTVAQSPSTIHHGYVQPNNPPRFQAGSILGQQDSMPTGLQAIQGNTFQSNFSMNTPPPENFSAYLQYPSSNTSQHQSVHPRDISRVGSTSGSHSVCKIKRPKKNPKYPSSSELAFNFAQTQQ
ncbi:hypothetical protein BJ875DRAFT_463944 [Amylocarpus encephaloides]|uniref:Uncharacterized protein n=1 Tax=Amylocarpus encephaloides TaxID=45428 RepID=A0A9P7YH05_9HELO|nr:hypothetical protein BJ875DRAFT_463944 [Amylocarpus encephaloides]